MQTWQIASQVSQVGQEATFLAASAVLGGDYARLRTDCRLVGRGATGDLLSAYFGEGDQTLDFRTFQDHRAPDTTSNLLFKGAVGGRSHSVYTGLIRVRKEARGTNAFQTNRNIKLSDDAWAESVPNLEIENERRPLQPRLRRRSDRRGAALLPGEPGRATAGGRAAGRGRVLRRGRPAGSRCPAWSTRCAARIAAKLDREGGHG